MVKRLFPNVLEYSSTKQQYSEEALLRSYSSTTIGVFLRDISV
jgi:hypothetical protein